MNNVFELYYSLRGRTLFHVTEKECLLSLFLSLARPNNSSQIVVKTITMRRKETVSRRPRSTPSVIGQGASSAGVLSLRNGVVRTPTCRAQPSQVKRDKMHANTISTQCRNVSRKATARDLPLSRDPRCYSPCCAVRAQRTARRDFLLRRPPQLGQRVLFRKVQASRCVVVRPALTATATILFPPVLPTYAVAAF